MVCAVELVINNCNDEQVWWQSHSAEIRTFVMILYATIRQKLLTETALERPKCMG